METGSQNEKLGELLAELKCEVTLSDDEMLQLYALYDALEAEFGDIAASHGDIFEKFDMIHSQIPGSSVLKRSLSPEHHGYMSDREYYENRDPILLERLLYHQRDILKKWSTYFFEVVLPSLFGDLNGRIENGSIKSVESYQERTYLSGMLGKPQFIKFIRDFIRGRFVGDTLADVEEAMAILLKNSRQQIVSAFNAYDNLFADWRGSMDYKPYVGANFTLKIDDNLTYEVQLLTRRAALIGKLDHPVRIKRKVELSPELKNLLDGLAWGSHLIDFREYLGNRSV